MTVNLGKARLLIVDDDPEAVRILNDALHSQFSIVVAADAERGWELVNTLPPPEAIFLEIALSSGNPYEFCRRLTTSEVARNIPVILTGRKVDPASEVLGVEAGAADFVLKPYDRELVRVKLRRQLELKHSRDRLERLVAKESAKEEVDRLNAELKLQQEALQEVSQELQNFCYSISHDLRAPLRHLVGFSGALIEDHRDQLDGNAQVYLDCIGKAGRKMEVLVEAMLSLSRINSQEMHLSTVDLSALARECATTLQEEEPQRQVEFRIEEGLLTHADASLMRVAVAHLIGNAWKFSAKRDQAVIEFSRTGEGSSAVFLVRDNGAGFDMKYASRLFGPFQRLHQEADFSGTGIGLATVQRIIRRHGGKIWVDAKIDEGATFYFTLPG